jgi:hypothetical protein
LTGGAALVAFIFYAAFKQTDTAWPWHLAGQLTQFLVLFWAVVGLFAAWRSRRISQRTLNVLAVVVLMFDLWSYGLKSIRPGDDALAPVWSKVVSFMQGKPNFRVALDGFELVQSNGALAFRMRSHYGYDPIVLARYQAFLDSASNYFDRVYDLLNVRYVIASHPIEFQKGGPQLNASFETEGIWFYRRPTALPRAFVVHNAQIVPGDAEARSALHAADFAISRTVTLPAAPPCSLEPADLSTEEAAQLVGESPNHLELTTRSARAGLLVLSEVDYPGWQARVDGQPAQVLRADTILRAVCLPAGSHTVRFDFRPNDLVAGTIISCLALVVVMGAAIGEWVSARRKPNALSD